MKKLQKKTLPSKTAKLFADLAVNGNALIMFTGHTKTQVIKLSNLKIVQPSSYLANQFQNFPHKWDVYICAFGIDSEGEEYMVSTHLNVDTPVYRKDLADLFIEENKECIAAIPEEDLVSSGYIATPYLKYFSEKELLNIFKNFGVFSDFPRGNKNV